MFLTVNNFPTIPKDPTVKYHNILQKKTLQECNLIIDKQKIKYLLQKKPTPPTLKTRIKLHKQDKPIWPVVNNINTPSYKVAIYLVNILNPNLNLRNTHNITNSTHLALELSQLSISANYRLITYDIKDLFVNIPINEVIRIIQNTLYQNQTTTQTIKLTKTILPQNYFTFQHKIYHTNKGIAVGFPISDTIAEIFTEHYENTYIKWIIDIKNVRHYTRYVDNILIIYDNTKITHASITQQINQIHKDTKFSPTYETNNTINFLELQIMRNTQNLEISVYRKPTTTNTTIHHTSNDPMEHKTAAYRYYLSWMHSLPLNPDEKQKEWNTIQTIAKNNGFSIQHIHRINQQIQHNNNNTNHTTTTTSQPTKIRTTFTYFSPLIWTITKLFKHTNLQVTYKTTNTVQQLLQHTAHQHRTEHERSGLYKLTCNTANFHTSDKLTALYNNDTKNILDKLNTMIHNQPTCSIFLITDMDTEH